MTRPSPGGVERGSATSCFSKMNGDGLRGAWEVLMLRPIEGLLLLQLGSMIKCCLSDHPLSPTQRLLFRLRACDSVYVAFFFCYLVLFLSTFPSFFPPLISLCVLISVSSLLLLSAWFSLTPRR